MTLLVDCEEVEMEILKVLKRYDPEGCYVDWHIEGEFMQINASIKVIEQKRRELHYPDYLIQIQAISPKFYKSYYDSKT